MSNPHYKQIDDAYKEYLEVLRQNWLLKFPKSKNSDWAKYHDKYYELYSKLEGMPYRYKDYIKNLYLHDEMAEVIKKYRMKYWGEYYSKDKKKRYEEMEKIQQDADRCHSANDDCRFTITTKFVDLFDNCLKKHTILSNYYDYSLLAYMSNNFEKSFDLLSDVMSIAQREGKLERLDEFLDTKAFHNLGILFVESMAYEQAVEYLTKALQKDPGNKAFYFQRAVAYFESGQFDLALSDYVNSGYGETIAKSKSQISKEFNQALLKGLAEGCAEGVINFFPSLCHSIYGLEKALWADAQLKDFFFPGPYFANAAYNAMNSFIDVCKSIDQQMINECADELKILYQQFNQLDDSAKGQLIGHSIGKYGVEIFGFMAAIKVVGKAGDIIKSCGF
jgi:tetratricopeptide (TPR) repeat protein